MTENVHSLIYRGICVAKRSRRDQVSATTTPMRAVARHTANWATSVFKNADVQRVLDHPRNLLQRRLHPPHRRPLAWTPEHTAFRAISDKVLH